MQLFLSEQTAYIGFLEPVVFQDMLGFERLVGTPFIFCGLISQDRMVTSLGAFLGKGKALGQR